MSDGPFDPGFISGLQSSIRSIVGPVPVPSPFLYWSKTSSQTSYGPITAQSLTAIDPFFNWSALVPTDFRQNYSYDLVISNSISSNPIVSIFTFPMNPSSINVTIPIASSVSATMKGIIEDNNGAPFRPIVISGTTGVSSDSPTAAQASSGSSALDYLFKNTIQAIGSVGSAVSNAAASFSGAPQSPSKLNIANDANGSPTDTGAEATYAKNSGYVFFHNLSRFLDFYTSLKKTKAGASYRLSFHMHKDQMYYDVLLNNWSFVKAPGTVEYQYTIHLTAYRRRPDATISPPRKAAQSLSGLAKTMSRILGSVRATRDAISSISGVLSGIREDIAASFFAPVREVCLLASDAVGLGLTIADFPSTIVQQARGSVTQLLGETYNNPAYADKISDINSFFSSAGIFGSSPSQSIVQSSINSASASGQSGLVPPQPSSSPLDKVFANPNTSLKLFDMFNVSDLKLTPDLNSAMNDEVNRIRNLTIADWQSKRDTVQDFNRSISEAFGGGSATYNRINGLPPPKQTTNVLTTDTIETLSMLNDTIQMFDQIIVQMLNATPDPTNDYYNFYANYALSQGVNFTSSSSKFFVPYPADHTMEDLAVQYLGDADRWIEIAALNNLKQPFIDEVGYFVPLIGSGSGNQITLASSENLYIGQYVFLLSDTEVPVPYQIARINRLSITETVVSFEGELDLSIYQVNQNAQMHAYAPGTINPNQMIAIPSQSQPNVQGSLTLYPTVQDLTSIARIAKVDFLLKSDGDLAFSANDIQLASGMTNIVQAANMKLMTPLNSLLQHLGYGNPIQAGESIADFNIQSSINSLNSQFTADPRFTGIAGTKITALGPAVKIDLALKIADTQALLPLSANLPA